MPGWRQPLPGRILRQTIMAHRKVLPIGHVWGYCIFRMLLSGDGSPGIASVSNEIGLTAHRQPHSTTSDAPQTKQTHDEVGRRTTARSARRYKGYRGCSTSKQDLTTTSRLSTHSQHSNNFIRHHLVQLTLFAMFSKTIFSAVFAVAVAGTVQAYSGDGECVSRNHDQRSIHSLVAL